MRILFTSLLSLSASVVVVSVSGLDVSNNNLSDAIFIEGTPTGNLRRVLNGQDQGATDRGSRMLQGEAKDKNKGISGDFQEESSSPNTPGEGNGEGQGTTKGAGYGVSVSGGSCIVPYDPCPLNTGSSCCCGYSCISGASGSFITGTCRRPSGGPPATCACLGDGCCDEGACCSPFVCKGDRGKGECVLPKVLPN